MNPSCSPGDANCTVVAPPAGTGSAGLLTYWTASSTVSSSLSLFWDNPNIRLGIGTSQPSSTVHIIAGTTGATTLQLMGLAGQTGNLFSVASSNGARFFEITNAGIASSTYFIAVNASTTRLDVSGSSTLKDFTFTSASSTGNLTIGGTFQSNAGQTTLASVSSTNLFGSGYLNFVSGRADLQAVSSTNFSASGYGLFSTLLAQNAVGLGSLSTSTSLVFIRGTETASTSLAIQGVTSQNAPLLTISSSTGIPLFNVNALGQIAIATSTYPASSTLLTIASSSQIFNISSGGNVMIGTSTAPNAALLTIATTSNIFTVLSNGRVGIGMTNPGSAKLHIFDGDISLDTSTSYLRTNTSDGSDTKYIGIAGGGAGDSSTRGGLLRVFGNENASQPGQVEIVTGNIANSKFMVTAAGLGSSALEIDNTTGNTTLSQDLVFSGNKVIRRNTSDGSDSGYIAVGGGGATDSCGVTGSRGAEIALFGNDSAPCTASGYAQIVIGNAASAGFAVWSNGGALRPLLINGSDGSATFTSSNDDAWKFNSTHSSGPRLDIQKNGSMKIALGTDLSVEGSGAGNVAVIMGDTGNHFRIRSSNSNNLEIEAGSSGARGNLISATINDTTTAGGSLVRIESNILKKDSSSLVFKHNLRYFDTDQTTDWRRILQLRGFLYQSLAPADNPDTWYSGFGAEHVYPIIPEVVNVENGKPVSLMYERLAPFLVELGKDHESRIASLSFRVEDLEHILASSTSASVISNQTSGTETIVSAVVAQLQNAYDIVFDKGLLKVAQIITDKFTTKELCIEEVCIGKSQLQTLLNNTGVTSNSPPIEVSTQTSTVEIAPTEEASSTTATSQDLATASSTITSTSTEPTQ